MKPAPFLLHTPTSIPEVLQLLASMPNARLLAGGQSLMPMLNMRLAAPDHLVDINRVADLAYIREDGPAIVFGAMTRQRDIEFSALVAARLPLMKEAILNVGHRQTRNRGTIGGSLCHLDPSAELPTVAMAMDATLSIRSAKGARVLPITDFIQGFMTSALDESEMLLEIRIVPWPERHGACFLEFARRHGDFAVVSAAALLETDARRRITRASLTLGGVGPAPLRLRAAEEALLGRTVDETTLGIAAEHARACEALDDPAYPSWYRRRIAAALVRRALAGAFERARPGAGTAT